jgi:hypothetical protein
MYGGRRAAVAGWTMSFFKDMGSGQPKRAGISLWRVVVNCDEIIVGCLFYCPR